jgi:hypothetical protein
VVPPTVDPTTDNTPTQTHEIETLASVYEVKKLEVVNLQSTPRQNETVTIRSADDTHSASTSSSSRTQSAVRTNSTSDTNASAASDSTSSDNAQSSNNSDKNHNSTLCENGSTDGNCKQK